MSWKNIASTISLAGVCCLISASGAHAQGTPLSRGQNPPGGPGGPGGAIPPEMQAKMKAWQKWNETHKGIGDLQTLLRKVERLDKEPGAELNKQQAGKMLAIIKPWRTKTEMTNDQANGVTKAVMGVLNPTQTAKLATMQGGRGGMGGGRRGGGEGGPGSSTGGTPRLAGPGAPPTAPGGPGGGRPGGGPGGGRMGGVPAGGPGGPGGPGGFKMPDPPKNGYNPLNPATLPFEQMRPRAKKNLDDFTAELQAKAK
jgi:hypothetical protein